MQCQKVLVFQEWAQCGGIGPACENAAARLGMEPVDDFCRQDYPYTTCAFGSSCTELNAEYFQCLPASA